MSQEETNNLLNPGAEDQPVNYNSIDVEQMEPSSLSTKYVRSGFIKKVYSILCVQLLLTAGAVILGLQNAKLHSFMIANSWLLWVSFAVSLTTIIMLCCVPGMARSVPTNYILLFIFTLSEAYSTAAFTCHYSKYSVIFAASLTAAMVVGLTIYAFFTKTDFTMLGGLLFICLAVFMALSFLLFIFGLKMKLLMLIINVIGVLLFGVYLIYDTQLIIGGKHSRSAQISVDDYIIAALNLYLDILNIFIYILQIVGNSS